MAQWQEPSLGCPGGALARVFGVVVVFIGLYDVRRDLPGLTHMFEERLT
jgi:hypothetical protein